MASIQKDVIQHLASASVDQVGDPVHITSFVALNKISMPTTY